MESWEYPGPFLHSLGCLSYLTGFQSLPAMSVIYVVVAGGLCILSLSLHSLPSSCLREKKPFDIMVV